MTIPTKLRVYIQPKQGILKLEDNLEIIANYPSFELVENGTHLAHYEKIPKKERKIKLSVGIENKVVIILNSFRVNYIDHYGNHKELFQTYYIENIKKLYSDKVGSNFQIKFTFNKQIDLDHYEQQFFQTFATFGGTLSILVAVWNFTRFCLLIKYKNV